MRPNCFQVFTIVLCLLVVISVISEKVYAEVIVDGTTVQRTKIANWLTLSLGTTVTIGADGKISVGAGGNKGATRLRNMVNDATTSVKIKIVQNDSNVDFGRWQPTADGKTTTGEQIIDIADIEGIGNVLNSYGVTRDTILMHEITEVYEGMHGNLSYAAAHKKALQAEEELMKEFGTSFYAGGDGWFEGGYWYLKIELEDGSYVIIRAKLGETELDVEWFKEKIPCKTADGLIAISDPDPQVQIFGYDFGLSHSIIATWDEINSCPTGVALDEYGNLYVSENLPGQDEVRIFDSDGNLINMIIGPELSNPKGIAVDRTTRDIFVAVDDRVIRYDSSSVYLGWYDVPDPAFDPTDVAIWRNLGRGVGTDDVYDIYVSDRTSNQVYRFNVSADMNQVGYTDAFGSNYLVAPEGLSTDSWQQIWVASTGNNRIYRFLLNGDLSPFGVREFFVQDASRRFFDVEMLYPDGIYAVDETWGNGALLLYDSDGNLVKTYGQGTLQCPESVAIHFDVNEQNLMPFVPYIPGDCAGTNPMLPPWFDGYVFWQDMLVVLVGYGATPADPRWTNYYLARADFNSDNQIFWEDLLVVLVNYGKSNL